MKNPETFEEGIDSVLAELKALMLIKREDYGHRNITDFGEFGCLVRSNDKMNRLITLLNNKQEPKNESIEDSWIDLANYSIIALMLRRKIFELPL